MELSASMLKELLEEAKQAHAAYEKALARKDEDWAGWYARYIMARLREKGL